MSTTLMLKVIRYGFATWLTLYGIAAFLSPNSRIAVSAITDVAIAANIQPHHLLSAIFLIPGVVSYIRKIQAVGFAISTGFLSIYEVGLIISAVRGDGSYTSPVTFAFAVTISAFLLSVRDIK